MFMILKGKLPGESYYSKTFYDQNRKLVPFGQRNHFKHHDKWQFTFFLHALSIL